MSELVATTPDQIASLPAEQRGELITRALVESKQWLAVATTGTDPTPVAEFKAWAATVAEMTRQKGLASEIQLDAQEMVRRAERGIGLTVRNGQEAGEIATHGGERSTKCPGRKLGTPLDFLKRGNEMSETYSLTDDVTDEQFEEALEDARAEGNVSRANVIRKVQRQPSANSTRRSAAERAAQIREMAERSYTSRQIAEALGFNRTDQIVKLAREHDINIPADAIVGKTRRIDPERVIGETITTLEGVVMGIALLSSDQIDALDPEQAAQWSDSLAASLKSLNRLKKELDRVRA